MIASFVLILMIILILIAFYVTYANKPIDTDVFHKYGVYLMYNHSNLHDNKLLYINDMKSIFERYKQCICIVDGNQYTIITKGKIIWIDDYFTETKDIICKCNKNYFLKNYKKIPSISRIENVKS